MNVMNDGVRLLVNFTDVKVYMSSSTSRRLLRKHHGHHQHHHHHHSSSSSSSKFSISTKELAKERIKTIQIKENHMKRISNMIQKGNQLRKDTHPDS